jgi:hypothetical protein
MRIDKSSFSQAARKVADNEHRAGLWEVWPKYAIRQHRGSERYLVAAETDNLPPRVDLIGGRVSLGSSEEALMERAIERSKARREVWPYSPLAREPDLFLMFARLADDDGLDQGAVGELDTDKNAAAALSWAHDYGVLGLTTSVEEDGLRIARTIGGKADTVEAFAREAWTANNYLQLYEAATAETLDADLIASYMPSRPRAFAATPASTRAWALDAVASETQRKVAGNAYPALYGTVGRFVSGWDFINLLGAMWLQMFWLLTSSEAPRRCKNWECDRVIAYEQPDQPTRGTEKNDRSGGYKTRIDRMFCSKGCGNRHYYLTRTKPRRQNQAS